VKASKAKALKPKGKTETERKKNRRGVGLPGWRVDNEPPES